VTYRRVLDCWPDLLHTRLPSQEASSVLIQPSVKVRVTLRLAVYRQSVRLGDSPLETHDQYFYFPPEHLRLYIPYVMSSLTRGWICRLQLLLTLASELTLRYESRGAHGHTFTISDSILPHPGGPGPRIHIPQE
jgi:hypothetical protein